jgi:hypothetical protein
MISYYIEVPDRERPMLIGGEVLFRAYISKSPTIRSIRAGYGANAGECEIELDTPPFVHSFLTVKEGPPVTVTYRTFFSRPTRYGF